MSHFYPAPQARIGEIELLEKMDTYGGQSDLWTGRLQDQKLAVKLFRPGFSPVGGAIPDLPELLIPVRSGVIEGTPYEAFVFLEDGNLRQAPAKIIVHVPRDAHAFGLHRMSFFQLLQPALDVLERNKMNGGAKAADRE